jgi:hypothetical protein
VQLLEPARSYQLRDFRVPSLRAQAEMAAGMVAAAAADYRLILDNQGVDPASPMYSLAHLGLARVYTLQNNKAGSRQEYEAFFAIMKDADANLPVVKQARLDNAHLKDTVK